MKNLSVVAVLFVWLSTAGAVILLDTADPSVNTTAPGGNLSNSGWQYEGNWGGFLGTPISPNFFVSAAHIGLAGNGFSFGGTTYSLVGSYSQPGSDLLIWKIAGTFPNFAPLYIKSDEDGQHLVVIGRGTQRGAERKLNNVLRGWDWGLGDSVRRWGENDVADIVPYSGHDLLYATFDQHVIPNDHPNEAHLSSGDSGGAIFINDTGTWRLAGINFAVDGPFWDTVPANSQIADQTQIFAALFDDAGFYYYDDSTSEYLQIAGPSPQPTGFYASRISSELAWIGSVIADPQIGWEANVLTLTYWRLNVPSSELTYEVIESSDLTTWMTATTQDQVLATAGDLQQIKASVDPGNADHLMVRLRVTRPSSAMLKAGEWVSTKPMEHIQRSMLNVQSFNSEGWVGRLTSGGARTVEH